MRKRRTPYETEGDWLVPERGAPWLEWRFGTRRSILTNQIAQVKQVHGAAVLAVTKAGLAGEADGLVTNIAGLRLGIQTADCLPILMADLRGKSVAAVHAGWRGTAKGVVSEAVSLMEKLYGTKPNDLLVAMGPAIGKCCFEVGPEVAHEFSGFQAELGEAIGKCHLDLQAINAWQLEQLGVPADSILRNTRCTRDEAGDFWSYRREGEKAGRMWAVVNLKKQ